MGKKPIYFVSILAFFAYAAWMSIDENRFITDKDFG